MLLVNFRYTGIEIFIPRENIYLILAGNDDEAMAEAKRIAKETEDKEMFYDDRPAQILFKGIRKVIGEASPLLPKVLKHGEELTYSKYEVKTAGQVEALARGDEITVIYEE